MKDLSADTLKEWLAQGQAILIDVREPDEYRHEHIREAVNLPLTALTPDSVPVDGNRKIVFQCNSGNRSLQAARQFSTCGKDAPVYNLAGGIQEWKKAGFEVKRSERSVLPLQRQVQVAVGALVLLTVALGYFMHPAFLLATAFIGAGLLNAGVTGWCGLARLLAAMPWNE